MTHPYHLAVLLEVGIVAAILALRHSRRRLPWFVAIATCSAGLGVTYSRAAAIGVAAAVVALLLPRRARRDDPRRVYLVAACVMLAGVAATGLTMGNGWYARASTSTSLSSADSGRLDRAREAVDLIGDHPIIGRRARAILHRARRARSRRAVAAAQHRVARRGRGGSARGRRRRVSSLLLARRYLWASRETAAAFVLLLPYFAFDAYPYIFPVGLFLTALWFGLLEREARR